MLCIRQNIIRQPQSIINSPKFSPTNIFRYMVLIFSMEYKICTDKLPAAATVHFL